MGVEDKEGRGLGGDQAVKRLPGIPETRRWPLIETKRKEEGGKKKLRGGGFSRGSWTTRRRGGEIATTRRPGRIYRGDT